MERWHWSSPDVLFTTDRFVHRQTFQKTYQNVLHTAVGGDKCFTCSIRSLSPWQNMSESLKWKRFHSVCSFSTGIPWDLGQGVLFPWRKSHKCIQEIWQLLYSGGWGMANQTPRAVKAVVLLCDSVRSKPSLLFKVTLPSHCPCLFTPWLPPCCHDRGQVKAGPEDKQNEFF